MSEQQNQHLTPLGALPDWVDDVSEWSKQLQDKLAKRARADAIQAFRQAKAGQYFEAAKSGYLFGFDFMSSLAVGFTTNFTKTVLQLDSLDLAFRAGDSFFNPTPGEVIKDVLRLINIIPIVCEIGAAGRAGAPAAKSVPKLLLPIGKELPAVGSAASEAKTVVWELAQGNTCLPQSLVAAAKRANPKLALTLEGLVSLAEVDAEALHKFGTRFSAQSKAPKGVPHIAQFYDALRKIGVTFSEIAPERTNAAEFERVVKANPQGTLVLILEYAGKARDPVTNNLLQEGHAIIGRMSKGKPYFYDPTFKKGYEGLSPLLAEYPTVQANFPHIFFPNTVAVQGADNVIGSLLFLLLPISFGASEGLKGLVGTPKANGTVDRGPD